MSRKTLKKGLMKDAAQKLETGDLLDLQIEPGFISSTFNRLQTNKHLISMVKCSKQATWNITGYDKDGEIISKYAYGKPQQITILKQTLLSPETNLH